MRILTVSNFYPPHELGGWEQLTDDVRRELSDRGHQTRVLTSDYRVPNQLNGDSDVLRNLHLQSADVEHYHPLYSLTAISHERSNIRELESVVEQFDPHVILIQGMWNLPRSIANRAEELMPGRVVYYIASPWPTEMDAHRTYWSAPAKRPWLRIPKKALACLSEPILPEEIGPRNLGFDHVLCVSQFMQAYLVDEVGVPLERTKVVYNGVDPTQFKPREEARMVPPLRLLYAGRLSPDKGVHIALKALKLLFDDRQETDVTLSIVGGGASEYVSRLENDVRAYGLESRVRFVGQIDRNMLPSVMSEHDVLVFPSAWDEPLARIVQEAMACGLVVVGTETGGTAEILQDGVTGLTFAPEDPEQLAFRIGQLLDDLSLLDRLSIAGRRAVENNFTMDRMVDEIERTLLEVARPE